MNRYAIEFKSDDFSIGTVNPVGLHNSFVAISSSNKKSLFCLISKNGCATLTCNLAGINELKWHDAHAELFSNGRVFEKRNTNLDGYEEIIAIYRDPIDRFISLCNHIHGRNRDALSSKILNNLSSTKTDFINNVLIQCVISNAFKNNERIDQHVVSQTRFLEYVGVLNDPRLKIYPISQLKNVLESRGYKYSKLNEPIAHYVTKEDLSEHIINQIKYTYEKDYMLLNNINS